jgi:hypothetical protein
MTITLTAQAIFNAPGFDDSAMLSKAEREIDRLRASQTPKDMYDHMLNFAVTLAAVCDWTFHLHLIALPRWNGTREQNFTNWVRQSSADAFVFIDLANEYKHANRNKPSTLAEKMMLGFNDLTENPQERKGLDVGKGWMAKVGENDWFVYPSIKFNGRTEYFYDVAARAISWWRAFDPENAEPMDLKGNVLTQENGDA